MILDTILARFFPAWHAKPAPDEYLGLSQDQCQSVLDLRAHPGWKHYCRALECSAAQQAKPLLSGLLDRDQYLFQAGVLDALRRVAALPDALTNHLRNLDDRADRRSRADAAPTDPFANTVWYEFARRAASAPANRVSVRAGSRGMDAGQNAR